MDSPTNWRIWEELWKYYCIDICKLWSRGKLRLWWSFLTALDTDVINATILKNNRKDFYGTRPSSTKCWIFYSTVLLTLIQVLWLLEKLNEFHSGFQFYMENYECFSNTACTEISNKLLSNWQFVPSYLMQHTNRLRPKSNF